MRPYRLELAVGGRDLVQQNDLVALAEREGFTGAWVAEVNGADAITQATAIAAATTSMRVGTAIIPMQTRDPLLMAMTARSLQELSGGRFILGLGTSTEVIVKDWHGRDWGKPLAGTNEYVALLRRLLAGERVTEAGAFPMRRASLAARPLLEVPIYLAALNDGMLRLAARAGDGVILNFVSPRQVKRAVELVRAVRSEAGLTSPFEVTVFFRATVVDDPSAALARYQQELLTYLLAPVYQRFFTADGWGELSQSTATLWERGEREAALAGVPMEFIHERALVGSAASISGQLDEYAAAGMDTAFVLAVPLPGSDFQSVSAEFVRAIAGATAAAH